MYLKTILFCSVKQPGHGQYKGKRIHSRGRSRRHLRHESIVRTSAVQGHGSVFRIVFQVSDCSSHSCGNAPFQREKPEDTEKGNPPARHHGPAYGRFVHNPVLQLHIYGSRHSIHHPFRIPNHGGRHHGRLLQREADHKDGGYAYCWPWPESHYCTAAATAAPSTCAGRCWS